MKQMEVETEIGNGKLNQAAPPPPPPPPPPPLPRFWIRTKREVSVTNQEIAKFWRRKRMEEEDHHLAAIKAAARIRARNLTANEYRRFEDSLEDDCGSKESKATPDFSSTKDENNKELRVGIKDWWTKSKYAYLNQPAIETMDAPKRRASTTYIPNLCNYKPPLPPTVSFGIF
ncbi:hypothetical protein U1Q18_011502 [Sarracenia purpurea var. burkii]